MDERYRERVRARSHHTERLWANIAGITDRRAATVIVAIAVVLAVVGLWKGREVQVGELHRGAPDLRSDSRYNTDTAIITSKFSIGVDILNVIAETKPEGCVDYGVMSTIDEFAWRMTNLARAWPRP